MLTEEEEEETKKTLKTSKTKQRTRLHPQKLQVVPSASEMVVGNKLKAEDLNLCFEKLMMVGGGSDGKAKMECGVITEWKDIPMELLLRIMSLVDDRMIIVASGVCSGWRDAIGLGLTHLSLVWLKKNMNNLVLSLAPKFTKLQTLVLRQDKPQLQDNAVEAISTYCHELLDLDLSKSFKLTDHSLYALAHGCPNLSKLNISGCSAFSDEALEYLTNLCKQLKILNLCGCVKAASDRALQAIGRNCNQLQSLSLGWCENVGDVGVMSLAFGCPDLRVLDLCGCVRITDDSVIALANGCPHLTSLGLYYCQNITDRAMYSLAQSLVKNRPSLWESKKGRSDDEGLKSLNISQCTALTPPAVQAVCDSFPALHTCPGRHSLIISGCLSLTSVHCACAFQAHRVPSSLPHLAH
ncbi:F-box protein SKP2A-like [Rhodamnia argentea]|uniref:F-box protein SKP2A-like n=1 Tax=Rhodamnia argentea TaxID=178133 RepID=A0A8B8P2Z6_9MYRT|nr:F-box protein SKP2A-like [Rhodamnia argentea]